MTKPGPWQAEVETHLQSAAPELLEACEEVLRALTSPTRNMSTQTYVAMQPCVDQLRAAIAKAHGKDSQ